MSSYTSQWTLIDSGLFISVGQEREREREALASPLECEGSSQFQLKQEQCSRSLLSSARGWEPNTPDPTAGEDKSEKHRRGGCGEHLNLALETRKCFIFEIKETNAIC